jgi:hypothetical protein
LLGVAERGQGSMGWFYGLKLHLVVNDRGEILACRVTAGNVDDQKPIPELCQELFGKLIADRGYISQALFEQLLDTFGLQLITRIKSNMKNRWMVLADKLSLRKRSIIESVVDQLKNIIDSCSFWRILQQICLDFLQRLFYESNPNAFRDFHHVPRSYRDHL